MNLLIDTNIFLELLMEQEKAEEVRNLLSRVLTDTFFLSHYSLYSMGTILFKRKQYELFYKFLRDMVISSRVSVLTLSEASLVVMETISKNFNLDFDDAYQYTVAKTYNLTLVSFDKDFDRTDLQRKTPAELEIKK